MKIVRKSILDGREYSMDIELTQAQTLELQSSGRRAIQNICPNLSADEREFLLSGITPEKWIETFGSDEEDE